MGFLTVRIKVFVTNQNIVSTNHYPLNYRNILWFPQISSSITPLNLVNGSLPLPYSQKDTVSSQAKPRQAKSTRPLCTTKDNNFFKAPSYDKMMVRNRGHVFVHWNNLCFNRSTPIHQNLKYRNHFTKDTFITKQGRYIKTTVFFKLLQHILTILTENFKKVQSKHQYDEENDEIRHKQMNTESDDLNQQLGNYCRKLNGKYMEVGKYKVRREN